MSRTAVVAGVGPGLGESLARKFAAEGCAVGLFARSGDYLADLEADLQAAGHDALAVETDVSDPKAVEAGFAAVRDAFGPVDVLVNHASAGSWKGLADLSVAEFESAWRTGALGAFCCSQEAVADMRETGGGTVVFTGATSAVRGRAGALAFSSAKFAARGMAESMAQELGSEGIHVAHVVIDGGIRPPGGAEGRDEASLLDPDDIAEVYWRIVEQDTATMTFEVHLTNGNIDVEFL